MCLHQTESAYLVNSFPACLIDVRKVKFDVRTTIAFQVQRFKLLYLLFAIGI